MKLPEYKDLLLEQKQEGIWLLTINRPKAMNALNDAVIQQLLAAFDWLQQQEKSRVILITGVGNNAFIAGADISAMQDMDALEARKFSQSGMHLMHRIENCSVPVIALVNGYALGGGCELAMSCDFALASENAVFGQPEVTLGVPPGFGGSQRLIRRVGRGTATQLLLTGEQIKAEEAYRIGLCNQVVAQSELLDAGLQQAQKISRNAPRAVSFTKELANKGADLDIKHGCQMETELFSLCFATADQKEGMRAFSERRPANFTGC